MDRNVKKKIISQSLQALDQAGVDPSRFSEEVSQIEEKDFDAEEIMILAQLAIQKTHKHVRVAQEQKTFEFVYTEMGTFADQYSIDDFDNLTEVFHSFSEYLKEKTLQQVKEKGRNDGLETVKENFDQATDILIDAGIDPEKISRFEEFLGFGDDN